MNDKNISIYLFTISFPFGKSEPFISEELNILCSKFKNITILPLTFNMGKRDLPPNVKLDLSICIKPNIKSLMSIMHAFFQKNFWKEFLNNPSIIFNLGSIKRHINHFVRYVNVKKWLSRFDGEKNSLFYTYWITGATEAIGELKRKNYKLITRCHSYDLYKERGYIIRQYESLKNADLICPISRHGYDYLAFNYPDLQRKMVIGRLGVKKINNLKITASKLQKALIVSCSYILPIKRIDRIIDALAVLSAKKLQLRWIHFGGGPYKKAIIDVADKTLKNTSIDYIFKGSIDNEELIKFYEKNYTDLFINTSDVEGIPVSIMEALGAGIPVIAPDIGGIKELIDHKNGYLLPPDCDGPFIAEVIERILFSSDLETMRVNARNTWKMLCNSELNYSVFCDQIYRCYNN